MSECSRHDTKDWVHDRLSSGTQLSYCVPCKQELADKRMADATAHMRAADGNMPEHPRYYRVHDFLKMMQVPDTIEVLVNGVWDEFGVAGKAEPCASACLPLDVIADGSTVHIDDIDGATRVIYDEREYPLRDQAEAAVARGREQAAAIRASTATKGTNG